MRLAESIARWLGRVEIVLAGADDDIRDGQEALTAGDPLRARAAAQRALYRAPDSPIAMALLADACEMAGLEDELSTVLEALAKRAASRAEVWVRLGRAKKANANRANGAAVAELRDCFSRALSVAESGSEARHDALLELADLDLALGDAKRAELWLDRFVAPTKPDVALRRAEARLLRGDAEGAKQTLLSVSLEATNGRASLALGRALLSLHDVAAFTPLIRATVLETPGASEALSSALAQLPTGEALRLRIRTVVEARNEHKLARWRAAFARAEGARDRARIALLDAVRSHDHSAVLPLLEAAVEDRDVESLRTALAATRESSAHATILEEQSKNLLAAIDANDPWQSLDWVASVAHPQLDGWADALAEKTLARIVPRQSPAEWSPLLSRFDAHARSLADIDAIAAIANLSEERARPVRLAIVGEFNAGKSTFINALIGQDVAPTGVLPTTATLHHLRYAADPIAKIILARAETDTEKSTSKERLLPLSELRATLRTTAEHTVSRVELLLPISSLTRVEILDTPGFNAPNEAHVQAAYRVFEEADVIVWLVDATQALKQSERTILERAKAAEIPVQILINKADRLSEQEGQTVLASVRASLDELGLRSWREPIMFSAKRALLGRLGDAEALTSSGWGSIEQLFESEIIAQSDDLKERALRRRARAIAERLAEKATAAADREIALAESQKNLLAGLSQTAAWIERDYDNLVEHLEKSIAPAAAAWAEDMASVIIGRDPKAVVADRMLIRYRIDRGLERFTPPLSHALLGMVDRPAITIHDVRSIVRPLIRGALGVTDRPESATHALARGALTAATEYLFARAQAPIPVPAGRARSRDLRYFVGALVNFRETVA